MNTSNFQIFPNTDLIVDQGARLSDAQSGSAGTYYRPYQDNEGNEDTAIPLSNISAALVDLDGSESLAVLVQGLPIGSVLTDGTFSVTSNALGQVDVSGWDLANLSLRPPQDFTGTLNLTVTATATETANGNQSSSSLPLVVTVYPVNDAPVANNDLASTPEDTPLILNVLGNDSDVDGDLLTITSATASPPVASRTARSDAGSTIRWRCSTSSPRGRWCSSARAWAAGCRSWRRGRGPSGWRAWC